MKKNNKNTYIIIALICLILLNIGSVAVVLTKNVDSIPKDNPLINKVKSIFNIKDLVEEVVNFPFFKNKPKEKNEVNEDDEDLDLGEDFIIIDTIEEYENFIVVKDSKGKGSIEDVPEPLNIEKVKVNKDKPYIFIYHTHATETFSPHKASNYHNSDNSINMVNVGRIMTKVLKAGEHNVIHEKTHHDIPSYNQSYSRSLNTLNKASGDEPNLKFFFDVHRDGMEMDKPGTAKRLASFKTKIDDKDVATFSLVIGPKTPNYDQVLSFAKYIKAVSDVLYPDLCTGIIIKKTGKFNQFISDYTALLEIGSNGNTVDEVEETAKLVGEILSIAIENIKE